MHIDFSVSLPAAHKYFPHFKDTKTVNESLQIHSNFANALIKLEGRRCSKVILTEIMMSTVKFD